jgi:hypothetical protein
MRQTRRTNCLPYQEPSNVTRQTFAAHVAVVPQFSNTWRWLEPLGAARFQFRIGILDSEAQRECAFEHWRSWKLFSTASCRSIASPLPDLH